MRLTLPTEYKPPVPVHGRTLRTCRGVVIGGAIAPRMPQFSGDAELIQEALLERRTARPLPLVDRIVGAVWRWC
ncbi:hypothetical protein BH11PSE13_BH11PSE13_12430 [soil metagenome]